MLTVFPQHGDGFMMKFYAISEVLTPVLAWGFLGTNSRLVAKCTLFKVCVYLLSVCVYIVCT